MVNRVNVTSMSNKHSNAVEIILFFPLLPIKVLLNKGRLM